MLPSGHRAIVTLERSLVQELDSSTLRRQTPPPRALQVANPRLSVAVRDSRISRVQMP